MTEKENEIELEPLSGSELPLVSRDETPPLLLDLPDGQQLVVGKLPDGIVIEIATWRGTGRPDSRTNRMMLGVSYDDEEVAEEKSKRQFFKAKKREAEEQPPVISPIAAPVQAPIETSANVTLVEPSHEPSLEPSVTVIDVPVEVQPAVEVAPAQVDVSPELEEIVAIDDANPYVVLIKHEEEAPKPVESGARNMQDIFGARPRTQVTHEGSKLDSKAHEIVKKEKTMSAMKFNPKRIVRWLAFPLGIALLIFLAAGPGGISITHPVKGAKTSLSSAENALVIVKAADSYSIGDNVVANVEADGSPAIFGSIAATSDKEYVLTENNLYHSALKSEVKGKVILVMPGLGFLAGLIGF
jgi:hypothetical protein